MNILVVTPCRIEFDSALNFLKGLEEKFENVRDFGPNLYYFPKLKLYLGMGGHGKVEFALKTQMYISRLSKVKRVYCAGAAGGISPKRQILDIIFAQSTIEHDYRERFDNRPAPEFYACEKALARAQKLDSLIVGRIASGDEDIICSNRASELFELSRADAVAWEGAGGARACRLMNIPFVEIRGISDVANNDAPQDFAVNVKVVMPKIMKNIIALEQ